MSFLDNLKKDQTVGLTENGAKTYTSTLNHNLDLYSQAGAIRTRMSDAQMMFAKAYGESKSTALRNLAYLRDVRSGLGEREAFRQMFKKLIDEDPVVASKMMIYIPFLGRWDDFAVLYHYATLQPMRNHAVIKEGFKVMNDQLGEDLKNMSEGKEISLMAKWIPSTSVKNKERKQQANRIAHDLGMDVGEYRKLWSKLRKHIGIVETKLSDRDYDKINFETLPSRALYKYREAFKRHMGNEYDEFIDKVDNGEISMNASNILPYEIVKDYQKKNGIRWMIYTEGGIYSSKELNPTLETTWKSLDDHIGKTEESAIVVADTSASMSITGDPWMVAQSLAIYSAERLKGPFANHFITFSRNPELIEIHKDWTLKSKIDAYNEKSIVENTDIAKVFDLILDTAVASGASQDEIPAKIIIVSDMEFDEGTGRADETIFEKARKKFQSYGYKIPNVVFWNVDSRNANTPVRHNEQGVALVSGLTPQIFKQILLKEFTTPLDMMLETLYDDRYNFVEEVLSESGN